MTSDFMRGLHRFALGLHRSCPSIAVDDLLQDALERDLSGVGCTATLYRVACARNAMRDAYRRESWWQSRVDSGADPDMQAGPVTPEGALLTAQLRRIVRARVQAHVDAEPKLRPAVEVVLYAETPRGVAAQLQVPVTDIYDASASLRARLRADHELQRLWLEAA